MYPVYTQAHTRGHRKTQLIRSRHIGHLGHFLLPISLWERSRSQILIPLVWSQRSAQFWEMAKSESPKVNYSRWEVTEHEVRTTNMPTICERSVCAFHEGWISKLFTFFPIFSPAYGRFNRNKNIFCFANLFSWFFGLSFFASSSCDTLAKTKRIRDISTSLLG